MDAARTHLESARVALPTDPGGALSLTRLGAHVAGLGELASQISAVLEEFERDGRAPDPDQVEVWMARVETAIAAG